MLATSLWAVNVLQVKGTFSNGIAVLETVQINIETLSEVFFTQIVGDHTNNASTLTIRDGVKDLIDVSGFANVNFDRMRVAKGIHLEGTENVIGNELLPDIPFREEVSNSLSSNEGSKALHFNINDRRSVPSFNQSSFHHSIVTRFPNHWWASSWLTT